MWCCYLFDVYSKPKVYKLDIVLFWFLFKLKNNILGFQVTMGYAFVMEVIQC